MTTEQELKKQKEKLIGIMNNFGLGHYSNGEEIYSDMTNFLFEYVKDFGKQGEYMGELLKYAELEAQLKGFQQGILSERTRIKEIIEKEQNLFTIEEIADQNCKRHTMISKEELLSQIDSPNKSEDKLQGNFPSKQVQTGSDTFSKIKQGLWNHASLKRKMIEVSKACAIIDAVVKREKEVRE